MWVILGGAKEQGEEEWLVSDAGMGPVLSRRGGGAAF